MRYFSLILLSLFLLSSCGVKKKFVAKKPIEILNLLPEQVIDQNLKTRNTSKPFRTNSTISITREGKRRSANANWTIIPGSQVHLLVSYLGFSIAKGSFEPDSIKGFEKLKKNFIKDDYKLFNQKIGFDIAYLENVENLLQGIWFLPEATIKNLILLQEYDGYKLSFEPTNQKESSLKRAGEAIFDSSFRLKSIKLFEGDLELGSVIYDNWVEFDNQDLPSLIKIESLKKNIFLEINHNKFVRWENDKINLEIPKNYNKFDWTILK